MKPAKAYARAFAALAVPPLVLLCVRLAQADVALASNGTDSPLFNWPPDATTILLFWPILSAVLSLVYHWADGVPRLHAVLSLLVKAGIDLPGILDALKRLLTGALPPSRAAAKAAKITVSMLVLAAFALTQGACLSSAPIVPVTPQNQAQVSTCQRTALLHDGVVVGDIVFGGAGATLGTVAAALPSSNTDARTGLAVGAAVAGGLSAAGTVVAAVTAANFANGKCTDVVEPLPAKHPPSAAESVDSSIALARGDQSAGLAVLRAVGAK